MSKTSKRNAILLLGMHRSGTSAATRVFSLLGYDLPKSLMGVNSSNPVGHWESDAIVVLNDILLKELGSSWDSWQYYSTDEFSIERKKDILEDIGRHLRLEFPGKKDFILKDPRISRLGNLYLRAFEQSEITPNVVMSIRNPLSVADSLQKRDNMPKGDAALLWLRYVLDAEYCSRGHNRAFFSYEALLSDSQKTLTQISKSLSLEFPLNIETVTPQLNTFLDEGMKHHARTAEELVFDPIMRGWVDQAYSLLMGLCVKPDDDAILSSLDVIREELDHVAPVMENLRSEANLREAKQSDELADAKDVNNALSQQIKDYIERSTQLTSKNQVNETELKTYKADLALANKIKSELSARIEDMIKSSTGKGRDFNAEKQTLKAKLEQTSGEALQLSKTLEQKGQELAQRLEAEKQLREELSKKETELNETQKNITRLEKELQDSLDLTKQKEKELQDSLDLTKQKEKELQDSLDLTKQDLQDKIASEKSLMLQLEDRIKAESALNAKINKMEASERKSKEVIKTFERDHAHFKAEKTQEIQKLKTESDDLLARNFDLAHDVQTLKAELENEKRAVIRPAIRRTRGLTGKLLRVLLPLSVVDRLAAKIPPREKQVSLIASTPNPALPKKSPGKTAPTQSSDTVKDKEA